MQKTERYVDMPLTNFPVSEDTWNRMSDVNIVLMPLITQFNEFYKKGDITSCNQLLKNHPDLLDCFFNAEKWNCIRDAVIALERYYLEEVETFIQTVAQHALGIQDQPSEEQMPVVAYSAAKVNSLLNALKHVQEITLLADKWSDSFPFTQTVSIEGITAKDSFSMVKIITGAENAGDVKTYTKLTGLIFEGETGDGIITFKAFKKPTKDFTIGLKGV